MSKRRPMGSIAPRFVGKGEERRQVRDKWMIRVSLGVDPRTGAAVRVNQLFQGSKKEAEAELRRLLDRKDVGQVTAGRLTLEAWLKEHERLWSSNLAPATRLRAKQSLELYLPGHLRGKKLRALTPKDFQMLYAEMEAAGKAPGTVRYFHRVLRSRLEAAVDQGHLAFNPLAKAKLPAHRARKMTTFSAEQAAAFLSVARDDEWAALWYLLLMTGLRPGEALGARWADIDGQLLRVQHALVRIPGEPWRLEPTKTRQNRTVPLPEVVVKVLGQHRARQARVRLALGQEFRDHGFIFASERVPTAGEPLHWHNLAARHFRPMLRTTALRMLGRTEAPVIPPGTSRHDAREIRRAFDAGAAEAVRVAGLAGIRPYDSRHSTASLLLAAGEHPKVVAELLGHSRTQLTLDTYSHVTANLVGKATDRLSDMILPGARDVG